MRVKKERIQFEDGEKIEFPVVETPRINEGIILPKNIFSDNNELVHPNKLKEIKDKKGTKKSIKEDKKQFIKKKEIKRPKAEKKVKRKEFIQKQKVKNTSIQKKQVKTNQKVKIKPKIKKKDNKVIKKSSDDNYIPVSQLKNIKKTADSQNAKPAKKKDKSKKFLFFEFK